jgi:hypothetical protein
MNTIRFIITTTLLTIVLASNAQPEVEMADRMRADGKIYVVVGIILIVLSGLIVYLFAMDKKVKKLENLLKEKQIQTKAH